METQPLNKSHDIKELRKLAVIIEHIFERGWITEAEKKQVDDKKKYEEKELEIYDLIKVLKDYQNAARLLCAIRCIKEDDTGNENTDSQSPNQIQQNEQEIWISKYLSLLVVHRLTTPEGNELFLSTRIKNKVTENCITSESSDPLQHLQKNNRNPFETSAVVIKHLFGFLNLKDIIKVRGVCKKWRDIGNSFMALGYVVMIDHWSRGPTKFLETFTRSSLEQFSSFLFQSYNNYKWRDVELANVFNQYQKGIRELELGDLYLNTTDGDRIISQDITPWISRSPLVKQTDEYNTKLKIYCWHTKKNGSTVIKVPLGLLKHIKDISLKSCFVNLKYGIKISPVNLDLDNVRFYHNEYLVPEIVINDIIDFSKIKTIKLDVFQPLTGRITNVILDLDGKEILEELTIISTVKVVNWESSNLKINKLNMKGIPFVEKTEMEITELVFTGKMFGYAELKRFDLSALPESIEKLYLNFGTIVVRTGRIFLPKLKFLCLEITNNPDIISLFRQCPALVEMIIMRHHSGHNQLQLRTSWIPRSVKMLQLTYLTFNCIIWQLEPRLWLENLIIKDYTFSEDKSVIAAPHIHADNLVLTLSASWLHGTTVLQDNDQGENYRMQQRDDSAFLDFVEHIDSINWCRKLYVGPFNWETSFPLYELSRIAEYVDKQSTFYVFENGKGKAINESEFKKHSITFS